MATRGYVSWARLQLPVPILFGQGATAQQGAATPGVTVTLTGQQAIAAVGSLAGGTKRGYVSWARLQIPTSSGTVVTLTGQQATATAGTLVGIGKRGYVSWARLQIPSANTVLLTGQAATAAGGTLGAFQGTFQALTGQQATAAAGTLGPTKVVALTGQQAVAAAGSVTTNAATVTLTGLQVTALAGTLTPDDPLFAFAGILTPNLSVTLTGQGALAQAGVLAQSVNGSVTVPLVGQVATAQRGAFSGLPAGAFLTGLVATAQAGVLTPIVSAQQFGGQSKSQAPLFWHAPKPATRPTPKKVAKKPAKKKPAEDEAPLLEALLQAPIPPADPMQYLRDFFAQIPPDAPADVQQFKRVDNDKAAAILRAEFDRMQDQERQRNADVLRRISELLAHLTKQ